MPIETRISRCVAVLEESQLYGKQSVINRSFMQTKLVVVGLYGVPRYQVQCCRWATHQMLCISDIMCAPATDSAAAKYDNQGHCQTTCTSIAYAMIW